MIQLFQGSFKFFTGEENNWSLGKSVCGRLWSSSSSCFFFFVELKQIVFKVARRIDVIGRMFTLNINYLNMKFCSLIDFKIEN